MSYFIEMKYVLQELLSASSVKMTRISDVEVTAINWL